MKKTVTYRIQCADGGKWLYVMDGDHRVEVSSFDKALHEVVIAQSAGRKARIEKTTTFIEIITPPKLPS